MKGKFTWTLLFGMLVLVVGCGRNDKESDELLDAFLAGEIPAFYGDAGESSINFDQLPVDEEDWISYSVGERIDLDNDGENELILNGPYGGMYIDRARCKRWKNICISSRGGDSGGFVLHAL